MKLTEQIKAPSAVRQASEDFATMLCKRTNALPLFLAICMTLSQQSIAHIPNDDDKHLDASNDWVMYLEVKRLDHYLRYPGSRVHPIINIRVSYRVVPEAQAQELAPKNKRIYEDLWCHNGITIGSHRVNQLSLGSQKIGTIIVSCAENAGQESASIASAIAHVTLDLKLKKAIIAAVVVPIESFNQVCTDLGRYGFYKHESVSYFPLSLHITSNPPAVEKDTYLFSE